MAIPSFYHPHLNQLDSVISLDESESSHAVKSRRLKVGQEVRLFNGKGLVALGSLSIVERREVMVELNSFKQFSPAERSVSIAVAIPKGDRQKVMIDMLTQLGIFEIIPLRCERSITKVSENMSEKWLKVAIESCKQSQNPWLPIIADELDLTELLSRSEKRFVVADADGISLQNIVEHTSDITVLVGPEGGFSEQEFTKLNECSVTSIRIGPYILRTEAAAVAAAVAFAR